MDRDRLFIQTVDWLAETADGDPDEHRLLLASGRLRLLLLDSQRLLDQVNAARKFDIRYRIVRLNKSPYLREVLKDKPLMWAAADGLSPDNALPSDQIESVRLEAFLHERVMIYMGEDVTVRDLIDHLANVAGGVHAGKAREPRDEKLNQMAEEIALGGIDAPIRCLHSIVGVVVEALRPLRDAIAGEA